VGTDAAETEERSMKHPYLKDALLPIKGNKNEKA
jgi:hypothetical protein